MPAQHPPVDVRVGDIYLHDFVLGEDNADTGEFEPYDILGNTYSVSFKVGGDALVIADVTAEIEGGSANGTVRVTVPANRTAELFATPGKVFGYLRNDTIETTIVEWEIKEDV